MRLQGHHDQADDQSQIVGVQSPHLRVQGIRVDASIQYRMRIGSRQGEMRTQIWYSGVSLGALGQVLALGLDPALVFSAPGGVA
jgi:hypothetical protein